LNGIVNMKMKVLLSNTSGSLVGIGGIGGKNYPNGAVESGTQASLGQIWSCLKSVANVAKTAKSQMYLSTL